MLHQTKSNIRLSPVTGPSAWTADALDEANFIKELSKGDASQILALLTQQDQEQLSDRVKEIQQDVLNACENGLGFVVLRGLKADHLSIEEQRALFLRFCVGIGTPVTQNKAGDLICDVKDQQSGPMASKNIRGFQTNERLELHTDSSDILGLYCLRAADSGGGSVVVSSATVYNAILKEHPEYLSLLYTGVFYDSRGQEGDGLPPGYRNPIYYYDGERLTCRYYLRDYVAPAYEKLNLHFSAVEQDVLDAFESVANRKENRVTFQMQDGDLVFYSNNVVMHGRSAYCDAGGSDEKRWLLRTWLNPDHPRELPDHFAKYRFGYDGRVLR